MHCVAYSACVLPASFDATLWPPHFARLLVAIFGIAFWQPNFARLMFAKFTLKFRFQVVEVFKHVLPQILQQIVISWRQLDVLGRVFITEEANICHAPLEQTHDLSFYCSQTYFIQ